MESFGIPQNKPSNDFAFDALFSSQPANHYNNIQDVIRSSTLNLSAEKI
jgi:hypothetical protein